MKRGDPTPAPSAAGQVEDSALADQFSLSVVMPVHAGVDPEHFDRALKSIYDQTLPADEIVVVEDGPLTARHHDVLRSFRDSGPPLRRLSLPENRGVAAALQAGICYARAAWIARMDADDIALPTRFEQQVTALRGGDYDLIGAAMVEFDGDERNPLGVRRLPQSHDEMAIYMRRNNPINHPTCIYRRALALRVGGYRPVPMQEDYDFFARLLTNGARMYNLADPLVLFRGGESMLRRRKSAQLLASEALLQRNLHSYGIVGPIRMVANIALRTAYRLLPRSLLAYGYRRLFYTPLTAAEYEAIYSQPNYSRRGSSEQ